MCVIKYQVTWMCICIYNASTFICKYLWYTNFITKLRSKFFLTFILKKNLKINSSQTQIE